MPTPAAKTQNQNLDLNWKSPFRLLDVDALLKRPRLLDFELIAIAGIRYDVTASPPQRQLGSDMFGQRGTALLEHELKNSMKHGEIAFELWEDGCYSFDSRSALAWLVKTIRVVNEKLQVEIEQLNLDVYGDEDKKIPPIGIVRGPWKFRSKTAEIPAVQIVPVTTPAEPPEFKVKPLHIPPAVREYLKKAEPRTRTSDAEPSEPSHEPNLADEILIVEIPTRTGTRFTWEFHPLGNLTMDERAIAEQIFQQYIDNSDPPTYEDLLQKGNRNKVSETLVKLRGLGLTEKVKGGGETPSKPVREKLHLYVRMTRSVLNRD